MAFTLADAARLLREHHMLREMVQGDTWSLNPADFDKQTGTGGAVSTLPIQALTYDTRSITTGTMLFCKGRFHPEYLSSADGQGLLAYVSEAEYSAATKAVGLIVDDVYQAMSLLADEFYGHPQRDLTLIGITGTKGKTTTAYFTQAILNAASEGRAALFSSVANCLDGTTYAESSLTTPESLDALRMMRHAVDNGMRYLVMEVSSQAYKVGRVYGFTFDVGAFLNLSPDHISPIEHPTFEDYFHCKRQLVANSRTLVLGADCTHADLIEQDAAAAHVPVRHFRVLNDEPTEDEARQFLSHDADTLAWPDLGGTGYRIVSGSEANIPLEGRGGTESETSHNTLFHLSMDGDFNYANAAAALSIVRSAGVDVNAHDAAHAIETVRISGRMEEFEDSSTNTAAIVDFAHNFASVNAVIDFALHRYADRSPRLTLVTGSAGGKAIDRRQGIVEAAQGRVDEIVLTADDPDREDAADICAQMQRHLTDPSTSSRVILERGEAVQHALRQAQTHDGFDVVLIIGKGEEQWIKIDGKHVPYEGDTAIVKRMFAPSAVAR